MTYLWSHGVDEKGQSGLVHVDPTTTPMFFHATPLGVATPGLRTAGLDPQCFTALRVLNARYAFIDGTELKVVLKETFF